MMNSSKSVCKSPCISVVDDDESVREALESLFKSTGYRVQLFASAEEFLSSSRSEETKCLIVDMRMGGMSGLELQAELCARDSRLPIVFITAHDDEHVRARALCAGAVEVLIKPFSEEALLKSIQDACSKTIEANG